MILLVEDNEDDVFFMQRAMKDARINNPLHVIENGQEAIHYLAGKGRYADRSKFPLPALILLDLKLPFKSGLEVLEWKAGRDDLPPMVCVVLTTSRENDDIEQAYQLGANSYLVKPPSAEKLLSLVNSLKLYWLELNEYPQSLRRTTELPNEALE
jgi:CheY-like chemotaxis protein